MAPGRLDVYHQASLHPNPAKYDIAGKGLANMVERELAGATYEVDAFGVQAHYEFRDIHDRAVVINIREQNPRTRKPFGLLAPMGAAAAAPSAMPLVLLHDFYFVRKRHTAFEISIDGQGHQPDHLPIPLDFSRMTFARYSPRPLIATLNPALEGPLEPLAVAVGEPEVQVGETTLSLAWAVLLVFIALIPALVFPPYELPEPTGQYAVATAFDTFTDENRIEAYRATGAYRSVNVEFWYPQGADGVFPLVIFSHGGLGIRRSNVLLYQELASHGYVVGGVYDLVDTDSIGVMGHSLGGSAASGIGRQRTDIGAVMALEAPFMDDIVGVEDDEFVFVNEDYPVPVLNVYSDSAWGHLTEWPQYARNAALLSDPQTNAFNAHIGGVGHLGLTDLALSSPFLVQLLDGTRATGKSTESLGVISRLSLEFFDCYLKNQGEFVGQ